MSKKKSHHDCCVVPKMKRYRKHYSSRWRSMGLRWRPNKKERGRRCANSKKKQSTSTSKPLRGAGGHKPGTKTELLTVKKSKCHGSSQGVGKSILGRNEGAARAKEEASAFLFSSFLFLLFPSFFASSLSVCLLSAVASRHLPARCPP